MSYAIFEYDIAGFSMRRVIFPVSMADQRIATYDTWLLVKSLEVAAGRALTSARSKLVELLQHKCDLVFV